MEPSFSTSVALVIAVVAAIFIFQTFKIVPQQNAWVVERLGKYDRTLAPGLEFVMPFLERVAYKHSLKEVPLDVPSQVCITRDNTQLQVDGIIYFQVTDPMRASYGSSNYIVGDHPARADAAALGDRQDGARQDLRGARPHQPARWSARSTRRRTNWGVKVLRYEIKDLTPPAAILHAMQAQITAEREKRALIAASEGRKQEQINIATGEREAFIARSEGQRQAEINQAQGEAAAIVAVAEATAEAHPQGRRGDPPAGRRAGGAAQGRAAGGRGLRAARAEEQHDDRAEQPGRGLGPDRQRHGAQPQQRRAARLTRRAVTSAKIAVAGEVDERFKSHAWKACGG